MAFNFTEFNLRVEHMGMSEALSIAALIISFFSFGFSLYVGLRDRAKLIAKSVFIPSSDFSAPHIKVMIANSGRRPLILRMLIAVNDEKLWFGQYLGDDKSGLRLGESEHHEMIFEKEDLLGGVAGNLIAADLQIEDSLGNRHPVREAKNNLRKLLTA